MSIGYELKQWLRLSMLFILVRIDSVYVTNCLVLLHLLLVHVEPFLFLHMQLELQLFDLLLLLS